MVSLPYSQLRDQARSHLSRCGKGAFSLILLHAGVSIGIGIVLSLLHYILDQGIAQTGGLSGMDARTTLEAIQTLLNTVQMVAMPFWTIGYLAAVITVARGGFAQNRDLLTGFRYFGVVLRGKILSGIAYVVAMLLGTQAGSLLFMLTPAAKEMLYLELDAADMTVDALLQNEQYMQSMLPAVPFVLGGALLMMLPVYYRLRMMDYVMMDEPRAGALYALLRSLHITKKQTWALFKLDLHFWWFYLLELLVAVLCYGDYLLPLVGVELPMSREGAMYLFYALALVAELGLYAWKKNQVYVTYALAYDRLRDHAFEQVEAAQPQPPKSVPWQYE